MNRSTDPQPAGEPVAAATAPAGPGRPGAARPDQPGRVSAGASVGTEAAARRRLRLTPRGVELLAALGAVLLAAVVSGYRVSVAHTARYPGHADPAFTYGVAQSIAAGKGPNIDYVWHFLVPGTPLHHYAFDYWLPLPSRLMSRVLHGGGGLPAALELNVALIVMMCAGSYALARALSDVPWVPAVSAAAALVQPAVSAYAMQAESAVYLGAFALPAMAAAVYARRWSWLWPVAGAFAGLAAMSRSEGLLLCVVLGIAALAWREHGRTYLRVGLLLAGYLATSASYLLSNLSHFGSPLPPAATAFPFISSYEDLFAPHVQRTPAALLGGGPIRFFGLRVRLVDGQLAAAFTAMSPIVSVLVLTLIGVAVWGRYARRPVPLASTQRIGARPAAMTMLRSNWLVSVGFLLVVFVFDALIVPAVAEGGAIVKVMITGVPILLVLAVVQLGRLRLHPVLTALCCLVLAGYPLTSVAFNSRATIRHNNDIGRAAAGLATPLRTEAGCLGRPVVLMTRQPWEINQATGVATVALPTGSLAEILEVARQYGVTDIDNPAIRLDAATMAGALAADGPFARSAAFGSRKIYRIRAATTGARC
ncbi:MAG TPA: hypothetical protein VGX49_13295 [Jatrophihabitans sp.]|nr:hypothetical protein [Jatrophihabitans sp.]